MRLFIMDAPLDLTAEPDAHDWPVAANLGDTVAGCFTIREVMRLYRIGRCTAYDQARLYLEGGPGHGIPCIRLGHSIRFPIAWIEAHIGGLPLDDG
ncbi:MAG: hypothetical protein QM733_04665 [Ilumatobacteraceae bacterium]